MKPSTETAGVRLLPDLPNRANDTKTPIARRTNVYNNSYKLDLDSQIYTNRQHLRRIGNFYAQVINKHVLQTSDPTPLLMPEKRAYVNKLGPISLSERKAVSNKMSRGDQELNDRILGAESQLEKEIGISAMLPLERGLTHVMS